MKRSLILSFLLVCLAFTTRIHAMDLCCTQSCTDCFGFESVLTVEAGGGYRQDTVKWKTFPESAPGTIVREKWDNVGMGIIEADAQFLACENYLLKVDFDYGWTSHSGKQHIHTFETATGAETGNLKSHINGRAYDLTGAVGYQFNWCCYRYALTPIVGYSYNFQKFVNHKYHNELLPSVSSSSTNAILAHNTYRMHWSGPLIGFITAYQIAYEWQVAFSYMYHWARYHGTVKEHFPSGATPDGSLTGKQRSHWGHANEIALWTTYEFCCDWLLNINFDWKCFEGSKGKFSNDTFSSSLRNVTWTSWNVGMEVGYVF